MPAVAQPALGATLSYSIDSGSTWVAVGQVTQISGVGGAKMGNRDTTVLSSSLHTARPTIATIGPVSFSIHFDPTDTAHETIRDWANTAAATDPEWKIVFAVTGTPNACTFSGFVTSFEGANAEDVDSNLEADVEIYVNTIPVWA
jgi:hypothetical protein